MKYDETHPNVWSSSAQINNFLSNQIPFRNNFAKDNKTQSSDSTTIFEDNTETSENNFDNSVSENNKQLPFLKQEEETATLGPLGWFNNKRNNNLESSDIYKDSFEMGKDKESDKTPSNEGLETTEPSHHARRPMNAFLIFCKRHRTIVKNRYPHLENRAVTKILGEWWAGLEPEDKSCYTELAKQYKNAFFSANPNFKWYKLPAPPLRTLHTRPGNISISNKSPTPSKQLLEPEENPQPQQLFTPGKLADETQLGSITSLINESNNTKSSDRCSPELNTDYNQYLSTPPVTKTQITEPAKPFKKRVPQKEICVGNSIVRSIFPEDAETNRFDSNLLEQALESFVRSETFEHEFNYNFGDNLESSRPLNNNNNSNNLTQQELINKVVDHMCSSKQESGDDLDNDEDGDCSTCLQDGKIKSSETRKSVRSCKGLRYLQFMREGKLFVNKRSNSHSSSTGVNKKHKSETSTSLSGFKNKVELRDTIKKLAERTIGSIGGQADYYQDENDSTENEVALQMKMFRAADFNLDEKIEALPSLSLEKFQQKKKENKKRKFLRNRIIVGNKNNITKSNNCRISECEDDTPKSSLTGSRKRKPRKQSITRLDNNKQSVADLDALATLAEVAAKKAKMDQNQK